MEEGHLGSDRAVVEGVPAGSLGAHFDNVLFALDVIFDDGFESGDTSAWSNSVP